MQNIQTGKSIKGLIILAGILTVLLIIVKIIPFKLIMVRGDSMEPTYSNNQFLIARYDDEKYKTGDIVVADFRNEVVIKRVIAQPHDEYWLMEQKDEGKDVDILVDPSYINLLREQATKHGMSFEEFTKQGYMKDLKRHNTPADYYIIRGDNMQMSYWALIHEDQILGKIVSSSGN